MVANNIYNNSECIIRYTTTDSQKVELFRDDFDAEIISHTYTEEGTIEFSKPITKIPANAFLRCNNLLSITIPYSVKSFYTSSFARCPNLNEIKYKFSTEDKRCIIIKGVLKVFASGGLTEYEIPQGVTKIGKSVFQGCTSLRKIIIPNSVEVIDDCAFQFCRGLQEIVMSDSIIEIGQSAFSNCSKLEKIQIPNRVQKIGDWAFVGCESLREFNSDFVIVGNYTISTFL